MKMVVIGFLSWSALIAGVPPVSGVEAAESLQDALYRRYQPSRIEIADPTGRGTVSRRGKVLVLLADGVPAKPFRVVQATPKSPLLHVMDFARIEMSPDASSRAEAGPLRLDKGTRLVVLDVALEGNRVHLLTHTADPLPGPPRAEPMYGCTEFVFDLESKIVRAGNADLVVERIERWLAVTSEERICAPGNGQICLEP